MFLGGLQIHSQVSTEKISAFRESVLPKYNVYFTQAEETENGHLELTAGEKYNQLSISSKKAIMDNLVGSWQESFIRIRFLTKNELWTRDAETGKALLLDTWDLNAVSAVRTQAGINSKAGLHPWFVYVGGQGQMDKNHQVNGAINTRVGVFLLRNRWDFAWTFSGGLLGNIDSEEPMTSRFSTGLMSKVYFPIKKYNISPYTGLDISSTSYTQSGVTGGSNIRTASLLAGISWFIGHGSLDVGFRIGKEFNSMIGYTYFPKFSSNKNKQP